LLVYIPLLIISIIAPITNYAKEKDSVDLIRYVNRADLSDFAISVCNDNDKITPFYYILNSLKWAVPSPFIDKQNLNYSAEKFFQKRGWRSSDYRKGYTLFNIDYPDTLFSTGALIGGYIGLIIFPFLWLYLFNFILNKLPIFLFLPSYMASIPYMLSVEIAPWSVLPVLRNFIVTIIIFYVLIKIFKTLWGQSRLAKI
jgi:hypothetical protein